MCMGVSLSLFLSITLSQRESSCLIVLITRLCDCDPLGQFFRWRLLKILIVKGSPLPPLSHLVVFPF